MSLPITSSKLNPTAIPVNSNLKGRHNLTPLDPNFVRVASARFSLAQTESSSFSTQNPQALYANLGKSGSNPPQTLPQNGAQASAYTWPNRPKASLFDPSPQPVLSGGGVIGVQNILTMARQTQQDFKNQRKKPLVVSHENGTLMAVVNAVGISQTQSCVRGAREKARKELQSSMKPQRDSTFHPSTTNSRFSNPPLTLTPAPSSTHLALPKNTVVPKERSNSPFPSLRSATASPHTQHATIPLTALALQGDPASRSPQVSPLATTPSGMNIFFNETASGGNDEKQSFKKPHGSSVKPPPAGSTPPKMVNASSQVPQSASTAKPHLPANTAPKARKLLGE